LYPQSSRIARQNPLFEKVGKVKEILCAACISTPDAILYKIDKIKRKRNVDYGKIYQETGSSVPVEILYGCIVPKDFDNLLCASRHLSAPDRTGAKSKYSADPQY